MADRQRLLAEQSLKSNEIDQAVAYAEKAAALAPESAACQHTLGVVYGGAAQKASLFKQFGLARKCGAAFQRAVALAPASVEFRQSLFEFYRQAPALVGGGYDKALGEAAAIKRLDLRSGCLDYATLYAGEKKFDLALAQLNELSKSAPGDAEVHWRIGEILEQKGDKAGARAAYQAALVADPKFSPAAKALNKL